MSVYFNKLIYAMFHKKYTDNPYSDKKNRVENKPIFCHSDDYCIM